MSEVLFFFASLLKVYQIHAQVDVLFIKMCVAMYLLTAPLYPVKQWKDTIMGRALTIFYLI